MTLFWLPALTLFQREVVRFLRQRHRIVGALGTPLVFWLLIGFGLGRSFRPPVAGAEEIGYLAYFFPGTLVLILLFTAIFSTISVIEDRREGFLQAVLVSPARPAAIAMGKILGGTALAVGQGLLFVALAPLLGLRFGAVEAAYIAATMVTLSFALTGLGFLLAWRMDSTQGFHAVMNLFLMPLWFLSGAVFPAAGAPSWLAAAIAVNPLSYGVAGLHQGFFGERTAMATDLPSPGACLAVTALFALVMFALAARTAAKKSA